MNYYFRVKYGYNSSDQVSITEDQLEKAIGARIKGVPVHLGGKFINGSNIIVIEPHYHRYTGWYDWYEPKGGDDWQQIERDCPQDINGVLEYYDKRVKFLINSGREREIGTGVEIPQIEKDMPMKSVGVKDMKGLLENRTFSKMSIDKNNNS